MLGCWGFMFDYVRFITIDEYLQITTLLKRNDYSIRNMDKMLILHVRGAFGKHVARSFFSVTDKQTY